MKIKTIKVKNFKSLKDTIEINLSQMCAIIGPNNSGKSNILNSIYKVIGRDWVTVNQFDEDDVYNKDLDRDIDIELEFENPYKFYPFKGADPGLISKIKFTYCRYKVGEFKGQRRLEKSCLTKDDKPVQVLAEKPKSGSPRKYKPLITIPQELQENIPVIYIGADRNLKNQLPSSRNSMLGSLLGEININFNNEDNVIEILNQDGEYITTPRREVFNKHIQEAISVLKTEEFLELEKQIMQNAMSQLGFELDEALEIYFNPLTSLDFYKSLEIWVKENNFNINATQLGSGFQNAIVISILKAFEERKKSGAIFLIEEPEMFLHPQMQRSLYKTLRKISETNQVIYVTHSANFITIPEFDEIRLVRKGVNGTKVIESVLSKNQKLKEKFIKELDPERNELFFATKILVVEGDTEKLAFPEYAKRMELDFDKAGTTIIEVGGKRNIIDFVELALSFEIPVALVFDTDSSVFKDNRKEELIYNELLEGYSKKGVQVFKFAENYESELKNEWTETIYNNYCQKYEKVSKVTRARLFACDLAIPIPEFVKPIITWAAK
jgi:predicted ATP-dependent endonuclease of OLD family